MASNDVIILDQILQQQRNTVATSLNEHEYFEIFTAEQILKDFDLSYDEISSGGVGQSGDGGIDSLYIFVNGELLQEDTDFLGLKKNVAIEVFIIQSKTSKSFTEAALDKFTSTTEDIFDLSKSLISVETIYNKKLLEIVKRFQNAYTQLASKFPKLRFIYCYATKGSLVNHTLRQKADKLKSKIQLLFSSSECECRFYGASELLELARRSPQTTYTLQLAENPISSSGKANFICLVRLSDYRNFISDEKGELRKTIFEANVRDYQGKSTVNSEIEITLKGGQGEDFWWLNNGVTVLATKATLSGKNLQIENPEIVNGLQTSREIFNYFKDKNPINEERNLLIRVVVPDASESRDRIIKATNSQTPISPASLRATDKIHRDIEEYLRSFNLFYDRRKNYYKNEGKPIDRIISISIMAQAVMSIALQRPNDARARPSSLLSRDEDYDQIFSSKNPIEIYYRCAEILRYVERFLKSQNLDRETQGDIKFHLAMYVVICLTKKVNPVLADVAGIDINMLNNKLIEEIKEKIFHIYTEQGATNRVAKSTEFLKEVKKSATETIHALNLTIR